MNTAAFFYLAYNFRCIYNRATTEEKCLYWKTASDLEKLLLTEEKALAEIAGRMGEAGKRLYSWERIASEYNALLR